MMKICMSCLRRMLILKLMKKIFSLKRPKLMFDFIVPRDAVALRK